MTSEAGHSYSNNGRALYVAFVEEVAGSGLDATVTIGASRIIICSHTTQRPRLGRARARAHLYTHACTLQKTNTLVSGPSGHERRCAFEQPIRSLISASNGASPRPTSLLPVSMPSSFSPSAFPRFPPRYVTYSRKQKHCGDLKTTKTELTTE